jgi:DNA-binding CsgD family transcriptional regulator
MNESQYDDLIGKIYDAAIMPELWTVFLERLSDILNSKGTALYLVDFASRSSTCRSDKISFIQSVRTDPETVVSYDRYYSKVNVWLEKSKNLPEGQLTMTNQLFPEQELVKTEWYNDWLKPQNYFHAMIAHLLKQDTLAVRLSLFRARQQPFSVDETALFARLVPHLHRACLIYKKLSDLKSVQTANARLLNCLPVGLILFDNSGCAVFVNERAETLIRSANDFSLNAAGRCLTGNIKQTRALHQLINQAIELRQSHAMRLHLHNVDCPLSAIVIPLRNQSLPFVDSTPSVALLIGDPDTAVDLDDKLLTECYDLSPAEAKLAVALLRGQTPNDYAQLRGISHNTVKTQLKQVLAKTGTHRQSELIQLLTTAFALLTTPTKE